MRPAQSAAKVGAGYSGALSSEQACTPSASCQHPAGRSGGGDGGETPVPSNRSRPLVLFSCPVLGVYMQGLMTPCCSWTPLLYITAAWTRPPHVGDRVGCRDTRACCGQRMRCGTAGCVDRQLTCARDIHCCCWSAGKVAVLLPVQQSAGFFQQWLSDDTLQAAVQAVLVDDTGTARDWLLPQTQPEPACMNTTYSIC